MFVARRRFLVGLAGCGFALRSPAVFAATYPSKPVKIIVPVAAGGATDTIARLLGQWLTQKLGQPFTIENRSGAGSNLGTEMVTRSAPDGYTLLMLQAGNVINPSLYSNLSFDFARDIVPVAVVSRPPYVMVVHPSLPVANVREFIDYAKANPGKINMASAGIGTGTHVAGELFKMLTGVEIQHVPYRGGGPALVDLVSGQMQVHFGGMPSAIQYIRTGTLRPLGVTSNDRSPILPDVPSVSLEVPGYEASDFYGLGAPRGTPSEVVERLNQEVNAWLSDSTVRSRLGALGGMITGGSSAAAAAIIAADMQKWAEVVKFSGAKPE